jgi:hypothetical protein
MRWEDAWVAIDDLIVTECIVRALVIIREQFGGTIHEAIDRFNERYEYLREVRSGDFTTPRGEYGRDVLHLSKGSACHWIRGLLWPAVQQGAYSNAASRSLIVPYTSMVEQQHQPSTTALPMTRNEVVLWPLTTTVTHDRSQPQVSALTSQDPCNSQADSMVRLPAHR